jgi:hypothetical protein
MRDFDQLRLARERQFRRFRNLIIAFQVAVVVAGIWLLTHPEAIGSWFGRLFSAAT